MRKITEEQKRINRMMGLPEEGVPSASLDEIKDAAAREVLTDEEYRICKSLGVEPVDYIEAKAEAGSQKS